MGWKKGVTRKQQVEQSESVVYVDDESRVEDSVQDSTEKVEEIVHLNPVDVPPTLLEEEFKNIDMVYKCKAGHNTQGLKSYGSVYCRVDDCKEISLPYLEKVNDRMIKVKI